MRNRYEQWIAQHGRVYENELEKEKRYRIFEENVKYIDTFNSANNKSYKIAPNAFTDLSNDEFLGRYTGMNEQLLESQNKTTSTCKFAYNNSLISIPSFVDWRQQGAVTSVKTQGPCGGCWAFAAVAALEGIYKIKTGKLVDFSEQNLIDCEHNSRGCTDGSSLHAFEYMQSKGIMLEQNYPYQGKQGPCKVMTPTYTIKGFHIVGPNDGNALMAAVSQQPVVIAIDSRGYFPHYSSGIYDGGCSYNPNHSVTLVGYGKDDQTGKDYWLVKNSWGESWGEKGYMRLLREVDLCPIGLYYPYVPILYS
ncbi:hypothetical protein RND81_06G103700 [Saponaria officinalis]|uniref:Uncharacterized protein n=1 Tax=Saponaria officinalis TaxID=3572 RepID=A0AAW1K8Y5_SAPOF